MNKTLSIALLLLLLLPAGCYDYSEPDEKAWVMAMGFDKGRQNVVSVTTVIAIPKNIAGGSGGEPASGGGGEGNFYTVTMEAPTMLSALELLNAMTDRRADLSHTVWFVFSRELAEDGIENYYNAIARFHQFRRSSHIIICEGRAEDFLDRGKPLLEDSVGKFYNLMMAGWEYTEFIPFDTFHHFYLKSHKLGVEPVAALAALNREQPVYPDDTPKSKGEYQAGRIPRKGGGEIEVMGGAVFKKGKMVGTLNGNQTGVQKIFFNTLKRTIMSIPDPEHPDRYIVVDAKPREKPRVEVAIGEDGLPRISARVTMEGAVMAIQSRDEYEAPDRQRLLEQAVERNLLRDIEETVARSQAMGADIFGFGLYAKKLFATWPQWVAYNWDEKYPDATVTVSVDYQVRRVGLIHESMPLR